MANFCKKYNFNLFTEPLTNRINQYDIYFHHDFITNNCDLDKLKYIRRCQRLINILETSSEDIIFCRKGHAFHNHYEHNCKYSNITNDIDDAEKLNTIIANKYPHLKYKIIVILICGKCFNSSEIYKSNSDKIEIYNIATPQVDDILFENLCCDIFKI
jgi:hypothetical protein